MLKKGSRPGLWSRGQSRGSVTARARGPHQIHCTVVPSFCFHHAGTRERAADELRRGGADQHRRWLRCAGLVGISQALPLAPERVSALGPHKDFSFLNAPPWSLTEARFPIAAYRAQSPILVPWSRAAAFYSHCGGVSKAQGASAGTEPGPRRLEGRWLMHQIQLCNSPRACSALKTAVGAMQPLEKQLLFTDKINI